MKKALLFFLFLPMISVCQDSTSFILPLNENGKIEFEKIIQVDSLSKNEIYQRVLDWFGQAFVNPEKVITYDNRETGKINGSFIKKYKSHRALGMLYYADLKCSIDVSIKEGRFKVVFSDFRYITTSASLEKSLVKKDGTPYKPMQPMNDDIYLTITAYLMHIEEFVKNYNQIDNDW